MKCVGYNSVAVMYHSSQDVVMLTRAMYIFLNLHLLGALIDAMGHSALKCCESQCSLFKNASNNNNNIMYIRLIFIYKDIFNGAVDSSTMQCMLSRRDES